MSLLTVKEIKKRDGRIVEFNPEKIVSAVRKAFQAVRGTVEEEKLHEITEKVVKEVEGRFAEKIPAVENVQDLVEKTLMEEGFYDVAKAYILYRYEHQKIRETEKEGLIKKIEENELYVTKRDGRKERFAFDKLKKSLGYAIQGYEDVVDLDQLALACRESLHDHISTRDISRSLIYTCRSFMEQDPIYSKIASRLLLSLLYKEVLGPKVDFHKLAPHVRETFVKNIKKGIELGRLDPRMADFDLERLTQALRPERDTLFEYLGAQTLYDRYFMQNPETKEVFETPQAFWMRIAMGLSLLEKDAKEKWAIKFYEVMSTLRFVPSTPTLFHSGMRKAQLSSCFLNTVPDDLTAIFKSFGDNAQLLKWSGGMGTDWTPVRATGALINSTGVESQGVIPFLKIANDTTISINRSGRRRGAACVYLETWHYDIEDFLELRKNTGDERRRTHDTNTAGWIPDLFMKRVRQDEAWTLFSPDEVPDLHELYGKKFEERYCEYEKMAEEGKIRLSKKIPARDLWRKMLAMLYETGHPWITFKDPSNIRSPQDHAGMVHNSNLCCIAADQRVVTDRGILTVGELYRRGGENKVVGLDGIYGASEMILPRPNAPMVLINTKEGYTHKVTPDHKVWVKDKGWVEAQHLRPGDKLLIQQREGLWGSVHDPGRAYLMGLIAGDGTFGEYNVFIDIWRNDFHLIPATTRTVHQVLAGNTILHTRSMNTPEFRFDGRVGKARLASAPLRRLLEENGFMPATKTKVPDLVWEGTRETAAEYLRGLYQADACIQSSRGITTIALASKDIEFLKELQILWANFGVKTSLNKMRNREFHLLPDGRGGVKNYWAEPLYRLLITSIRGCQIAEKILKMRDVRSSEAARQYLENLQKEGYTQKLYATFTHLAELPHEDAYCLTVDSETHAWTVNGLITKNTEITLNTSPTETAVCNLGSLNLARHIKDRALDAELIEETCATAMRILDNVIDLNFYPTSEARSSNLAHRPVGLGLMGFQDALYLLGINFSSERAVEFADESMERIAYHAILASSQLSRERGAYQSFRGSKWERGIFPIDTLDLLEEERGEKIDVSRFGRLDWSQVREAVKKHGMRNSNCLAIAPTATISNIAGCTPSIEPIYKNIYVKANMSGDFTVVNPYLVQDLKQIGLWDYEMLGKIKYHDGRISEIKEIPLELREKYKEVFEINPRWLIKIAAWRGKWVDQSQSLNLFFSGSSGRELASIYQYAWEMGLKTTYYLRTLAASQVEKATVDPAEFGATHVRRFVPEILEVRSEATLPVLFNFAPASPSPNPQQLLCKIDDPSCEACQ